MKMRLFMEMQDKFWLSLNIFTVKSFLRISCTRDSHLFSFERSGQDLQQLGARVWSEFPPYLPLLEIKEWIWMNNFLSVCQEMMCENSMWVELDR